MNRSLEGRRLLVVGASSGVGAAVVRSASRNGAAVVLSARRRDRLVELADECPGTTVVAADVCDESSVAALVDEAADVLGGIDAVVHTVGMSPLLRMADATSADWRKVLETNVVGAALVATATAPHLLASNGRLVVLSSKAVRRPFPDLGLYSTSKFALDGLLTCLPVEFPGLRVTRVVVGNTSDTDFASSWDPAALSAALDRWAASGVLGSVDAMTPDDVAETIIHVLTSPNHIDDIAVLDRPVAP